MIGYNNYQCKEYLTFRHKKAAIKTA